jgi:hypothetical protein
MSDENKLGQQPLEKEKKITLIDVIVTLWAEKVLIVIVTTAFIFLGLFVAFGSTEEFSSQVKLMPENQQVNRLGSLGGFARQFGITPGQDMFEGIPPTIYPEIARSLGLMTLLMEHEVTLPGTNSKVSLFEYFTEHQQTSAVDFASKYTIGLPITVIAWLRDLFSSEKDQIVVIPSDDPKSERIIRLTKEQ